MIFMTQFDSSDPNRAVASPSTDSGFSSLVDVEAVMGPKWLTKSNRLIVYKNMAFSTFAFSLPARIRIPTL